MGGKEIPTGLLWECQNETDHLEDQNIGGGVILKWIFKEIG
jgi:hypothetical protein